MQKLPFVYDWCFFDQAYRVIAVITILIDLGILFWIAWWLYKKQSGEVKYLYWPALGAKLLAGAAVGWVYFYHYGQGDTISYWHDGVLVSDNIISDPINALNFFWDENIGLKLGLISNKPRSLFFVKISGILATFSGGNYWMMALIISSISFLGAWYLFVRVVVTLPDSRLAAAFAFLFCPSVVFWSSGLIKESLGLASLFFLGGICLSLINNRKIKAWEWIIGLLSLWIGWNLKYYWIGVFAPISLTTVMVNALKRWLPNLARFELGIWTGLFVIFLFMATSIHPNFYPHRFLEVICENNHEFMSLTDKKNAITYHELQPSVSSVLLNSPTALIGGLFRPFVWEAHDSLSFAAALENLIVLALVLTSLPSLLNFFKSPNRLVAFAIIVYIALLAVFLALSTPNLGTLSRYKIGFLPFLVFLILYQNPVIRLVTGRRK